MAASVVKGPGLSKYFRNKIDRLQIEKRDCEETVLRLEAQRNELNAKVRQLREELLLLLEPGSHVGEVVKPMAKNKILVKVSTEGKYIVDVEKDIDVAKLKTGIRVALQHDNYTLRRKGYR